MKLLPALACNIVIFAWTLYCMALYFIGEDRRPDLKKGCASLKFFTTLSNVFSAFASAAWIIPEIRMLCGAAEEIGRGLFLLGRIVFFGGIIRLGGIVFLCGIVRLGGIVGLRGLVGLFGRGLFAAVFAAAVAGTAVAAAAAGKLKGDETLGRKRRRGK